MKKLKLKLLFEITNIQWLRKAERALNRSTSLLLSLGMAIIILASLIFRETVTKSFGYNGKGVATYPNGDIYDGHFKDGVSLINYLLDL